MCLLLSIKKSLVKPPCQGVLIHGSRWSPYYNNLNKISLLSYLILSLTIFFSCCSVTKLCLTLWDPMDCSMPGFPVLHYFPEFAQIHVHWVDDAVQPSYPLLPPSPPALNLSQNQGPFQWVGPLYHVAKVLELQLQHQSFQIIFRVDFL